MLLDIDADAAGDDDEPSDGARPKDVLAIENGGAFDDVDLDDDIDEDMLAWLESELGGGERVQSELSDDEPLPAIGPGDVTPERGPYVPSPDVDAPVVDEDVDAGGGAAPLAPHPILDGGDGGDVGEEPLAPAPGHGGPAAAHVELMAARTWGVFRIAPEDSGGAFGGVRVRCPFHRKK